jgi:hypothetical protein
MQLVTRCRTWAGRHPRTMWAVAAMLAVSAAGVVIARQQSIESARSSWGRSTTVYVAARTTPAGQPLQAHTRSYPLAVVPPSAVTRWPAQALARHTVQAGEVIVNADLVGSGVAARVPTGWQAVTVVTSARFVGAVSDSVVVYADGVAVSDGIVVHVDAAEVTVAVPADRAGAVSSAVLAGVAVVALSGGDAGG